MQLKDAKVLVTGGASGMGRNFSLNLAREGADVAVCDVNTHGLRSLEEAGVKHRGNIKTFEADVSQEDQVGAMMDKAWAAFGGLNVLVNNAGIFRDGLLVKPDKETGEIRKMSLKQWDQVISVDLTGPFLCAREFSERIIKNDGGPAVIVNISSIARSGNAGQTNYSAAKAGLVAMTGTWAKELARYRIRVGAVAPGFVDTPILKGMRPEVLQNMLKAVPLRRPGNPDEIFAGIRFIIECGYFTGRCIDIDGGMRL
jgi:3-oxoacyl-[acyl-carrier protein] reductase